MIHCSSLRPALRHQEINSPSGADRQRFGNQISLRRGVAEDYLARRRMFLIKLSQEGRDQVCRIQPFGLAWEISAVTVIAAGAKKENLDTGLATFLVKRDDIGLIQTCQINILMCLYLGQCTNTVADCGRLFEREFLARCLHLSRQVFLNFGTPAREKSAGLIDKRFVVLL